MSDGAPAGIPGDSLNWPMLKIAYPTDPDGIARLLPPGIEPGSRPEVRLTVYHFPVAAEPERGLVVNVAAAHDGVEGEYSLGYAIDQEQAVFLSRELWGQPKFLADVRYFRLGAQVEAAVTHKGHTFFEYRGTVVGDDAPGAVTAVDEWWVKWARSVAMAPGTYDLPPRVVHVHAEYRTAFQQALDGALTLRDSPWDPLASALPVRGDAVAKLWWPEFLKREITPGRALDPEGFWPFADTIGGSRFPGLFGGPAPGGAGG